MTALHPTFYSHYFISLNCLYSIGFFVESHHKCYNFMNNIPQFEGIKLTINKLVFIIAWFFELMCFFPLNQT